MARQEPVQGFAADLLLITGGNAVPSDLICCYTVVRYRTSTETVRGQLTDMRCVPCGGHALSYVAAERDGDAVVRDGALACGQRRVKTSRPKSEQPDRATETWERKQGELCSGRRTVAPQSLRR